MCRGGEYGGICFRGSMKVFFLAGGYIQDSNIFRGKRLEVGVMCHVHENGGMEQGV